MDTPRPDQIRTMRPEAEAASEADSLELMEMILGALGEHTATLQQGGKEAIKGLHVEDSIGARFLPCGMHPGPSCSGRKAGRGCYTQGTCVAHCGL
jgi:hypothetical protein